MLVAAPPLQAIDALCPKVDFGENARSLEGMPSPWLESEGARMSTFKLQSLASRLGLQETNPSQLLAAIFATAIKRRNFPSSSEFDDGSIEEQACKILEKKC